MLTSVASRFGCGLALLDHFLPFSSWLTCSLACSGCPLASCFSTAGCALLQQPCLSLDIWIQFVERTQTSFIFLSCLFSLILETVLLAAIRTSVAAMPYNSLWLLLVLTILYSLYYIFLVKWLVRCLPLELALSEM